MSQKCKFCFLLYLKEIYAQFVETNVLVKHNIYHELKLTIMDLDWQITWKHPVVTFDISFIQDHDKLSIAIAMFLYQCGSIGVQMETYPRISRRD